MATLADLLRMVVAGPTISTGAMLQRNRPSPAQTMVPAAAIPASAPPRAVDFAAFDVPATTPSAPGFGLGALGTESALASFAPPPRAYKPHVSRAVAPRARVQPDDAAFAPPPGYQNPTSSLSIISQAAAAEPPRADVQPSFIADPQAADPRGGGGTMEQLREYLGAIRRGPDPKTAMMDNLIALTMGGLNTAAAASRPGATPFGAFAEGNAGGLQAMLGLRQARQAAENANDREALSVLGTMANMENASLQREDTAAYRKEIAADRDERLRLERERLGLQGAQFDRQMQDREAERRLNLDIQNRKLGLDERRTAAEIKKDEAYVKQAGGAPGGANEPALVRTHQYLLQSGIETDPKKAWQMASRDYNEDKMVADIYKSMLNDPMFALKSQDQQREAVQGHLSAIRGLQGGAASPAAPAAAAPQGLPSGARQARDGQWWVPDQTSKSGWAKVVTTP